MLMISDGGSQRDQCRDTEVLLCAAVTDPWNHNYTLWEYFARLRGGEHPNDDFITDGWLANLQRLCIEGGNHTGNDPTVDVSAATAWAATVAATL